MLEGSMVTLLLKYILFLGYAFDLKVCQVLKTENEIFWHLWFSLLLKIVLLVYSFIKNLAENLTSYLSFKDSIWKMKKRRLVRF